MSHDDLIERAAKWLQSQHGKDGTYHSGCGVILKEFDSYGDAIPDVIGFNHYRSVVIECKVSRSDFRADQKKAHRSYVQQLGNYRYYLVPPDLIVASETPAEWGLLYDGEAHQYRKAGAVARRAGG